MYYGRIGKLGSVIHFIKEGEGYFPPTSHLCYPHNPRHSQQSYGSANGFAYTIRFHSPQRKEKGSAVTVEMVQAEPTLERLRKVFSAQLLDAPSLLRLTFSVKTPTVTGSHLKVISAFTKKVESLSTGAAHSVVTIKVSSKDFLVEY